MPPLGEAAGFDVPPVAGKRGAQRLREIGIAPDEPGSEIPREAEQVVQDHLTAAVHNLKAEGQDRYRVSARYESVLAHYGVEPRFIEVAKPNQNGCVERGHGVLKSLIRQALKLRRSSDFASVLDFERFVLLLVERLNRRRQDRWEEERKHLNPLPRSLPNTYTELVARVSRWSSVW